ncbi:MAG: oligoendopeptidase F [Anaerolineaceae bacterium]|nr:oligoendopeptidase F [Anaerolineaceae bacterium]
MTTTLPERHEIATQYRWNQESVFQDAAAWESALQDLLSQVEEVHLYQGKWQENADTLCQLLQLRDELHSGCRKILIYANFSAAVDSHDETARAQLSRAQSLYAKLRAAFAFLEPELLAWGEAAIQRWVEASPSLQVYAHYFHDLFRKKEHVRSQEVEQLMGMISEPFSTAAQTASILTNADLTFLPAKDEHDGPHEVANSTMPGLMSSEDRQLRRNAWRSYADGFLRVQNTLANNLAFAIKRDVFFTQARGFESSLQAALFPAHIPTQVFHELIRIFQKNIPTWHRYWRALRKALGVKQLCPYDIWAPLTQHDPAVNFEQAVEYISEGMAPLGEEYVNILRRGCLEERWVDVYPNRNKRAGAFSSGGPGIYPFIMMSHDDKLGGMSTLAHELGHSMHSYLTWQHQPAIYGSYSMFVAETASNFNQAMTRAHLFERFADDADFQLALISEAMSNFHRYFFIMPTLARFELEMHERAERGASLTARDMNSLISDLLHEGYGGEVEMEGDRSGITWAQFGHLYANFYVFQYATGISAAHELADQVLRGGASAAEAYLNFLKAGASRYPLDVLRDAGVNMRTPEAVETTFSVLQDLVERLESLTQDN